MCIFYTAYYANLNTSHAPMHAHNIAYIYNDASIKHVQCLKVLYCHVGEMKWQRCVHISFKQQPFRIVLGATAGQDP